MKMKSITYNTLAVCLLVGSVSGCGKEAEVAPPLVAAQTSLTESSAINNSAEEATPPAQWTVSRDMNVSADQIGEDLNLAAVLGDREIPYPVYPNGSHYRVGDENGLKIIVFETEDTFETVDAYYQVKAGMPRLSAMEDYVRYSTTDDDQDPWETTKPGIVIHQFNSRSERVAAGANDSSRTNIIMSFR